MVGGNWMCWSVATARTPQWRTGDGGGQCVLGSCLAALVEARSRTRAARVGATSMTFSPAATSCWAYERSTRK